MKIFFSEILGNIPFTTENFLKSNQTFWLNSPSLFWNGPGILGARKVETFIRELSEAFSLGME